MMIHHKIAMDDGQERDQPASTAEAQWKRDTFYSVIDTIRVSMKQHFEKNLLLLKSFALFLLRPDTRQCVLFKPISRNFVQRTDWMHSDTQRSYLALQRHSISSIDLQ